MHKQLMQPQSTQQNQAPNAPNAHQAHQPHQAAPTERRNAPGSIEPTNRAAEPTNGALSVTGYAARFNEITALPHFLERIAPGAFTRADLSDVRLLVDHAGVPLARSSSGTLRLEVDKTGLRYTAELPNTERGRELYEAIRRGDVSQSSFAFTIARQTWTEHKGQALRTIEDVGVVFDVSPVTYPAYPTTSAAIV
jgi:HK97 family phage prohead protease